jgi:mono/diheme cytochrome c family protein
MKSMIRNKRKSGIIAILLLFIFGCRFYFDTTTDTITTHKEAASVERGKNLTFNVCGPCHYDHKLEKFIGKTLNDLPKIAGHLVSTNLTQSSVYGRPPQYSDAELFYLLKTGISKSGKYMPYMMRPMMADEDVNDIIVYLRSNDEAVAAADTLVGNSKINFIGKTGIRIVSGRPQPYNKGVSLPDENNPVVYGRYLVAIMACYHCHSRNARGLDFGYPEQTKGYLQGGIKVKDPSGNKIRTPNLTPDSSTGIGIFSLSDFTRAVKEGITPSGRKLSPPMPKFTHLTGKQVNALFAYLRSLPPVSHKVKRS